MKELWVPLSAAIARQGQVDTIANNVANANTPGFKKDQLAFKEYLAVLEKGGEDINLPNKTWSPEDFYHTHGNENSFVSIDGTYTDFSQGSLIPTGGPLDVAIRGKGFFEIETPNGPRFTRRGNFSVSNEGRLITDQGYHVLSKQEGPGQEIASRYILIPDRRVSINADGEIFDPAGVVGKIGITEFKDHKALKKEGNSMFINPDIENINLSENKTKLFQGFIEQSNVNIINEMSSLIKASRNFESIQKVIKTYDSMAEKSVNNLLRF